MGLSGFIRGGISVLIAIIALYVIEITFPMDQLYLFFNNAISKLSLSSGWQHVAQGTLGGWVWYDRAFIIVIIAVFVWWGSMIFIEVDYGKRT